MKTTDVFIKAKCQIINGTQIGGREPSQKVMGLGRDPSVGHK